MRTRLLLPALLLSLREPGVAQEWTDRAEYDLALAVRGQPGAAERLPLLERWKQQYPNSAARQMRAELALAAAQALGDSGRVLATARELVATSANHFPGNYWIALLAPGHAAPSAAVLGEAEQSARRLIATADAYFASGGGKAAGPRQKSEVLALAHRTLGWAAWRRGATEDAEKELATALEIAPRDAEVSAWLGAVLAVQKAPPKQVQGIWHLARASFLDGDGALPANQRRDVRSLLEAAYTSYHGALDGLDEIGASASREAAAVKAPGAFTIETAAEAAQRKADEHLAATNPQLWTWVRIRRRLTGPEGEAEYKKLSEAFLPPLKGYVIRCDADPKPTEAIVGLQDSAAEEIVLKFDAPPARCAEVGVAVEFEGKPVEFTREPFRLSVAVVGSAVQGWPVPEKPAKPEKKD